MARTCSRSPATSTSLRRGESLSVPSARFTFPLISRFSDETRGRQTLANLVAAIGMTEIYDLSEWNSAVVDSILVNGDNYYKECRKDFNDADYEMCMDDLKGECSIFPFSFKVATAPVVEGTMFLVRLTQFNLYKALRWVPLKFFYRNLFCHRHNVQGDSFIDFLPNG